MVNLSEQCKGRLLDLSKHYGTLDYITHYFDVELCYEY